MYLCPEIGTLFKPHESMKKTITLAALLLAALPITAQIDFTLKGVTHPNAKEIIVGDMTNLQTQPTIVKVQNGEFTLLGTQPEQTVMVALDRDNRMQSFFIVDCQEISLDMNSDMAKGSVMNERLSSFVQLLNKYEDDDDKVAEIVKKTINDNQDNVLGAFAFNLGVYNLSYDDLKAICESDAPFLSHPLCKQGLQQMEALKLRAPGTMFKDVEEADTLGVNHKLSEYVGKGNYVLVDFWASWCGPCMGEMPNVKANYEKYKGKGFTVVGLSFDRSAEAWKRAIREKELNWVHLSDLKFWQTIAAQTYGIRSIPSSILCDPTGKIIDVDLRGNKLGEKLKEIYGF